MRRDWGDAGTHQHCGHPRVASPGTKALREEQNRAFPCAPLTPCHCSEKGTRKQLAGSSCWILPRTQFTFQLTSAYLSSFNWNIEMLLFPVNYHVPAISGARLVRILKAAITVVSSQRSGRHCQLLTRYPFSLTH